jgi:hypothetical protein
MMGRAHLKSRDQLAFGDLPSANIGIRSQPKHAAFALVESLVVNDRGE